MYIKVLKLLQLNAFESINYLMSYSNCIENWINSYYKNNCSNAATFRETLSDTFHVVYHQFIPLSAISFHRNDLTNNISFS